MEYFPYLFDKLLKYTGIMMEAMYRNTGDRVSDLELRSFESSNPTTETY